MNKQAVAQELVKVAKLLVSGDLVTEFVNAARSGDWEYAALFKNKTKPGRNPNWATKFNPSSYTEDAVRRVVSTPVFLDKQSDRLIFTFTGIAGRTDTYVFSKVPYNELIGAPAPRKKTYEIVDEVKQKLRDLGLSPLGSRYGKAGEFFGVHGGARVISVGNRDLLLNRLQVSVSYPEDLRNPEARWTLKESMLLSKVDDEMLKRAAEWVKAGDTSISLRQKVRDEYAKKNGYSVVFG